MKNIKYINVFWDFDGTLVNTVEGTAVSAQYALNKFGINTDEIKDLGRIFCGPPLKESFSKFLTEENDINVAIQLYKSYQAENTVELSKMYDGIKELLEKLKDNNIKLTIVTIKSRDTVIKILKYLDIYCYFDNVLGTCDEFPNQNKKELLEYAIKECKFSKSIMIGDRKSDIVAGNYCNIDTIAVLYGMDSKEILSTANPTYYAENTDDILNIIVNN